MKKYFGLNGWIIAVSLVLAYLVTPSLVFAAYFIGLGDLPGGTTYSQALDVSADGSVVVGIGRLASASSVAFRLNLDINSVAFGGADRSFRGEPSPCCFS